MHGKINAIIIIHYNSNYSSFNCYTICFIPLVGINEEQELSQEVNSCIEFVNNTQWIQLEGNSLMDSIISQIDQYINELEESINYDKR